jgi:hypothetical protein
MFKSTHNLLFEAAESPYAILDSDHQMFRIGTCEGQWGYTTDSYYILSVTNKEQGNGHLDDVFEWFENSAKRDGRNLLVLECLNNKFYQHLLNKRGFKPLDKEQNNCIKIFNKKQYNKLLRDGNEILIKGTLNCI